METCLARTVVIGQRLFPDSSATPPRSTPFPCVASPRIAVGGALKHDQDRGGEPHCGTGRGRGHDSRRGGPRAMCGSQSTDQGMTQTRRRAGPRGAMVEA
jgi:hypothetical protein